MIRSHPPIIEKACDFRLIDPSAKYKETFGGVLAVSVEIDAAMLFEAYRKGIFPWYSEPPVLWCATNPRMVLKPEDFICSHSLRKRIRDASLYLYRRSRTLHRLEIKLDTNQKNILDACASDRTGQDGTWIRPELKTAYLESIKDGFFHTIGCFVDGKLQGGLFFDSIGRMFFGESMFTRLPDLSKIALAALVALAEKEGVKMIDCQQETKHLASLGAHAIDETVFLDRLSEAVEKPPVEWSKYRGNFLLNALLQSDNA